MDILKCKTSEETSEAIAELVLSKPIEEVKEYIGKRFYQADDVVEFLYLTLSSKGNGILHGPGGFGKSQITKEFLAYYDIPSSVRVGHSKLDVEALLGIPNIKKLMDESSYEVAFEKSIFVNPGVLILEEFMDVSPMVAAALKDILTEGGYRHNDKFVHSKIGSVIICSNKSPDEASIDLSTSAFYKERFPYSLYTCWNSFTKKDYFNLYKTLYSTEIFDRYDEYMLLSDLCATSCTDDTLISPRIAIKARDAFIGTKNLKSLQYIQSLDYSKIETIQRRIKADNQLKTIKRYFDELRAEVYGFNVGNSGRYLAFLYMVSDIKDKIRRFDMAGDDVIEAAGKLISAMDERLDEIQADLLNIGETNLSKLGEMRITYEKITKYINS